MYGQGIMEVTAAQMTSTWTNLRTGQAVTVGKFHHPQMIAQATGGQSGDVYAVRSLGPAFHQELVQAEDGRWLPGRSY
jgi:hypothetical protein